MSEPARSDAKSRLAVTTIHDLSQDGRGVGRVDGKTVFVSGALPGEEVVYRRMRRRRKFDEGCVEEISHASPDRVVPRCAAFGVCGGCALQHMAPEAQRDAKRGALADALQRIGGLAPQRWLDDVCGPTWAYRRRGRLGVKYVSKKGRVLVGFRERFAPYIADMQRCEVLASPAGDLPQQLAALIDGLSIRSRLPQIEVAVSDDAVALVFRVLDPPTSSDLAALAAFGAEHDFDIYLQPGGLDSVTPLGDVRTLRYALPDDDIEIEFRPTDFIQVNKEINRSMVSAAVSLLAPESTDRVLDLFCGLGNFSLPAARRVAHVTGIEGAAELVARARSNAVANGLDNCEFVTADLFDEPARHSWATERYDLALLDPPRAGAREALAAVAKCQVRRIVYVSCHPGTLARDAGELVNDHGFTLAAAGIIDMFPHTTHVESIALFERGGQVA